MLKYFNVKMAKAFTLIEIMVAVLVFSIIIASVGGVFISSLKIQRRTLITQKVLDQTSYVLEYMSRTLRMAKKDLMGSCINQKTNYKMTPRVPSGLRFVNYKDECWEFFLENNQLKERREIGTLNEEILPLTSNELKVNSLEFSLIGETQNDNSQPRVTFSLAVRGTGFDAGQPDIKIQTTVSQRNLDVKQ